jgi:hypothetical protein
MLDEMIATMNCGIWLPALAVAFMLPDACGAAEFNGIDNMSSSKRYKRWYRDWVQDRYELDEALSDENVYRCRNAMMHETTGFVRGIDGFDRIVFYPPNRNVEIGGVVLMERGDHVALMVPIETFVKNMADAVSNWLKHIEIDQDPRRREAAGKLLQLRPDGFPPNIMGVPVIS